MVTIEGIRMWIFDRSATDNELLDDLEFTDVEIEAAMQHAAREYNSIFPRTLCVDPKYLPDQTNMFFEATAEALYKMRLHSLRRNHFEYKGGNVGVDDVSPRIKGLQEAIAEMSQWRQEAHDQKTYRNLKGFYQQII